MLNDNNNQNRNLTDVFKELQEKRAEYEYINTHNTKPKHSGITEYISSNKKNKFNYSYSNQFKKMPKLKTKGSFTSSFSYNRMVVIFIIIAILASIALLSLSYTFTTYGKEEVQSAPVTAFESNNQALNLTQIIATNIDIGTIKETVNEQRDISFSTIYQSSGNLPKGEEVVAQQGTLGKSQIIAVRTYQDSQLVDENIIQSSVILAPVEQIINIGTSEFLAKHQVHLGDTMYVNTAVTVRETASDSASSVCEIPETLDVKLLELSDSWCKISYDDKQGYVKATSLVSATSAPEMVEKARKQRILRDVKLDMPLNKKSGLAVSDFKKVLSGNSNDTNKIFENNSQAFYDIEQKYNINGLFLASLAIHESGWGTSQISLDKKNLFGYGAYDSDPYNGAYTFEDYKDGIEMVAKSLVKYYINSAGTTIYDNETATATYYNGSTLAGVNTRYSTDPDWHTKVFNYMQTLYNKL